jgi:hypothetical protein
LLAVRKVHRAGKFAKSAETPIHIPTRRQIATTPRSKNFHSVAKRSSSKSRNRKAPHRLLLGSATAARAATTIPTRWLNNVIALFLLPVVWVFTKAFFTCFKHAATYYAFWATEEFWFFALGAVLWVLAFAGGIWVSGRPHPLRLYVFGHELTHAIWARAFGGKIFDWSASKDGGFVLTDKTNFWIALTPYFHPLYSIIVVALYGLVSLFYDLQPFTPLLFALLGVTWAFHLSFTLWMIPKGQSDLSAHGTFFSLVVIYLFNLLILCLLLIFAAPEVTFVGFGEELVRHATDFTDGVQNLFQAALRAFLTRMP